MSEAVTAAADRMGETWHISADLCRRFLEGRVSAPEKRAFVRHLVGQCEDCLGLLGRIAAEGGYWLGGRGAKRYAEGDYAAAFQAAFKSAATEAQRLGCSRASASTTSGTGWCPPRSLDSRRRRARRDAVPRR